MADIYRTCPVNESHFYSIGPQGDAKYCNECGKKLIIKGCCESERRFNHTFCCYCGKRIKAEAKS